MPLMTPLTDPTSMSREDLLALAASLQRQVAELTASDEDPEPARHLETSSAVQESDNDDQRQASAR
jgi:hypothetical protein